MRKVAGIAWTAVMLLTAVGFASPAGAVGGTACANETGSATITPGLSLTPHDQTFIVNESLSGCVGGGVKTAKARATLKYVAQTCLGLAKTGLKTVFAETITWNVHGTSTINGTVTTGPKVGQVTINAKVTAGLFAGLHVKNTLAFVVSSAVKCTLTSAIKALTFKGVTAFSIQ
jgi:hypothetical protein